MKIQKKNFFFLGGGWSGGEVGGGGLGGGVGLGGQGGCERRTEVFVKIQKKNWGGGWGGEWGGWVGGGGQGGCKSRIEVFWKIQKKNGGGRVGPWGGPGWGVRMDVNEELKFL